MRVLVVDDSAYARRRIRKRLEEAGHEVLEAEGGEAALRLFAEQRPDVVTSDLLMPEMDGLALIRALKAADPAVRVVAVSADIQRASQEAALEAGAAAFVGKIDAPDEVVEAVEALASPHVPFAMSPRQRDAFTELINLAVGRAARGLEAQIGRRILLRVPRFAVMTAAGFREFLEREAPRMGAVVYQPIAGQLRGVGALFFPRDHGALLVRALVNGDDAERDFAGAAQVALAEVGNILLNAVLAGLGDQLATRLSVGLPVVLLDQSTEAVATLLLRADLEANHAIVLASTLTVEGREITACLGLLLPERDVRRLVASLERT
jgi:two-component system chemotaxis response regulator CheY